MCGKDLTIIWDYSMTLALLLLTIYAAYILQLG